MQINTTKKVGEIVAGDYRAANVFTKYGIDFCCGGDITINEACKEYSIDTESLLAELKEVLNTTTEDKTDYSQKSLSELADLIVGRHHAYVESNIPMIQTYLQKIAGVHGENHPELNLVLVLFAKSAGELTKHMKKEELMLFPYIKKLEGSAKAGETPSKPVYGSINNPIAAMLKEHSDEGERFKQIQKITSDYKLPDDACNTYKAAFHKLKEFHDDLYLHIHLENNILFPKALELEKEIFNN